MRRPLVDDPFVQASFDELSHILRWVEEREAGSSAGPRVVLIGGWAVYAYNPYFGSLDIDLVTNSRLRGSLMHHLRSERGYRKVADDHLPFRGVLLPVRGAFGIKIDFATFEARDPFEGVDRSLPYRLFKEHARWQRVGDVTMALPERGMLLLSKLKAAWDRRSRVEAGRSRDPSWERGKVVKDLADILALVDPDRGGDTVDLSFVGRYIEEYDFLVKVLELAGHEVVAAERYGVDPGRSREIVDRLLELVL